MLIAVDFDEDFVDIEGIAVPTMLAFQPSSAHGARPRRGQYSLKAAMINSRFSLNDRMRVVWLSILECQNICFKYLPFIDIYRSANGLILLPRVGA